MSGPRLAIVMKGWPRLSETFIAQEMAALEARGLSFDIWSLRHPTDSRTHPVHDSVRAPVRYLPEYLYQEPGRVLNGWRVARWLPGYARAFRQWLADWRRDATANRGRRFGQACVLAAELPPETRFIYAHFLHTPGSVARYAAMMRGIGWGFSAHAKDIWTIPDWEKREKLADCAFGATCTAYGAAHLRALAADPARIDLVYHGLDLSRFPPPPQTRPARDGAQEPVRLVSVGRLVEKKGFDRLLDALARLPQGLNWRWTHIGGGELKAALREQAERLGLADRIDWRGAQPAPEVIAAYRDNDLFILPSRIAESGDRDGLPNVLMEAASQKLAILSTPVSAIPEFVTDGESGVLTEDDPETLAAAILRLAQDPALRARLAENAYARLTAEFGVDRGIDRLEARLRENLS